MIPKTSIPLHDEQDSVNAQKAIQENREKNIAQIQVTEIETEGPLPSPYILRGYDEISPGAAKIIIDEFQKNSDHIRKMQELSLREQTNKDKRGQWMAFIILVIILSIVLYSLYLGNITFAGVAGIAFIGMAAQGFLKQDKEEKTKKNKNKRFIFAQEKTCVDMDLFCFKKIRFYRRKRATFI